MYVSHVLPLLFYATLAMLGYSATGKRAYQTRWETMCPKPFEYCNCERQGVLLCNGTKLTNSSELRHIPAGFTEARFYGNNFDYIAWDTFGDCYSAKAEETDQMRLRLLDLSGNEIKGLGNYAFQCLPELRVLLLNDNNLGIKADDSESELHHAFTGLLRLQRLELSRNRLSTAAVGSLFEGQLLRDLQTIDLSHNYVNELPRFVLSPVGDRSTYCSAAKLKLLNLNDNYIRFMNIDREPTCLADLLELWVENNLVQSIDNRTLRYLSRLPQLRKLLITENRFRCDCHVVEFVRWLNKTTIAVPHSGDLTCSTGPMQGEYLSDIDLSEAICEVPKIVVGKLQYGLMLSVCIMLVLLFFIVVYLNRKLYRKKLAECLDPFRNSEKTDACAAGPYEGHYGRLYVHNTFAAK